MFFEAIDCLTGFLGRFLGISGQKWVLKLKSKPRFSNHTSGQNLVIDRRRFVFFSISLPCAIKKKYFEKIYLKKNRT
jgi:hypothetical protein